MSSKDIQPIIQKWLFQHSNIYQCLNYSKRFHEADILAITSSLIATEVEIKITRSDFKADLNKKAKHERLAQATIDKHWNTPNKFYYACPARLIKPEEIPPYTGLLWIDNGKVIEKVTAPKLHRKKVDISVITGMMQLTTERHIFGCAYLTHKNRVANVNKGYQAGLTVDEIMNWGEENNIMGIGPLPMPLINDKDKK